MEVKWQKVNVKLTIGLNSFPFNFYHALEPELFDFHLFRFSPGETTEEATSKRKSKSSHAVKILNA